MGIPLATLAVVVATLAVGTAHAGGQYVGDNGSQAMQRAGAFTAKSDDPTALAHNPAGLAHVRRAAVFVGVHVVDMATGFARTGAYEPEPLTLEAQPGYVGEAFPRVDHAGAAQPIPMIVAALPIGEHTTIAAGFVAPHAYGLRDYPEVVTTGNGATAPAPQRYDTVYQSGVFAGATVGAAVRVGPRVTLGARAGLSYGRVVLRKYAHGLPNETEQAGLDTRVTIDATDNAIPSWGAGIHIAATNRIEIGASYASPLRMNAIGTARTRLGDTLAEPLPGFEISPPQPIADEAARCAPGGTEDALVACVEVVLPQTATVGARHVWRDGAGVEIGDVELDLRWEDWSANAMSAVIDGVDPILGQPLPEQSLSFDLRDVWSIRIGGARRVTDSVTARGGVAYDTAASDLGWHTLAIDTAPRITVGAGVGIDLGSIALDAGAAFAHSTPRLVRDIPIADPTDPNQRVQPDVSVAVPLGGSPHHPYNAGGYATRYLIASLGATARW